MLIIIKQSNRMFVPELDFITSVGHLTGGDSRQKLALPGKGPTAVITDLCVLRPDPVTRELTVSSIHPGITRETILAKTGWRVQFATDCHETDLPNEHELATLRDLVRRTAEAHGVVGGDA